MSAPDTPAYRADEPWYGARSRVMRGFVIGIVGYVLIVAVILTTGYIMAKRLVTAQAEYDAIKTASVELQSRADALGKQVLDLRSQYVAVREEKAAAEKTVAESRAKIAELQQQLDQIFDFKTHVVTINEIDEKMAYGELGEQGFKIFQQAVRDSNRKLAFTDANDPEVGFTSPGYAQHLLNQLTPRRNISNLRPRNGPLKNGDIVTYQPAYYMFYFRLPDMANQGKEKEFVIGMTTEGVLALDMNFGTRMGTFAGLQP